MRRPRLLTCCAYGLLYAYYFLLLAAPSFQVFAVTDYEQLFPSMMAHLLAGRFDVDPDAVGMEGFLRDGRTYSYFGIFPALLRLPLFLVPGWETINLTHLSVFLASCISVTLLIRTAVAVRDALAPTSRRDLWFAGLIAAIAFGGVIVPFLKANIYQEVVAWGFVFAAWFVRLALLGLLVRRTWTARLLGAMGCAAALGLLTRVSVGIGLYAAFGLLLADIAWRACRAPALARLLAWPAAALALGLLLVGIVNTGRWGSPFIFVDFRTYILAQSPMLNDHSFELTRIWSALLYYLLPVWGLPVWGLSAELGELLLSHTYQTDFYGMEQPPGSFLVTDACLLWLGAHAFFHGRPAELWADMRPRLALLLGLATPCLLMLTAAMLAHRYRVEFYPFLLVLGFLGTHRLAGRTNAGMDLTQGTRRLFLLGSVGVSVIGAHVSLLLYRLSNFGAIEDSFVDYYTPLFREFWAGFRRLAGA